MSRIGYKIIEVPSDVQVTIKDGQAEIKGEKGVLTLSIPTNIEITIANDQLTVTRKGESKEEKALHGTIRALLANYVTGVKEGWSKKLEIHGSGYRAAVSDDQLELIVGYSHPVKIKIPAGVEIKVVKNTITISGIDKQLVGAVAAQIRDVRKPEPYKGKGIKYQGEIINRKIGKALKATA